MDSSQRALQTNGKLFSNFGIIFRISYIFLLKVALVYACEEGEAFVLISTRSSINTFEALVYCKFIE